MRTVHHFGLAFLLALSIASLPVTTTAATERTPTPQAVQVEGRGLLSIIGCVGCVAGGLAIAMNGAAALLAAAFSEGSALAVAGCIAICADAIG